MTKPKRQRRSTWGKRRQLPSGRWQASYLAPDGQRYAAAATFDNKTQADAWLAQRHSEIVRDEWKPPRRKGDRVTVADYATTWLAHRDLKPRTVAGYRSLLDRLVVPKLGELYVDSLTPAAVRAWHAELDSGTPTQRAHAYALLKAICKTAVDDDLLTANPCRIRGAGQARRASRTTPATPDQLAALIAAMPQRYRAMTAIAGWCGLRFGEVAELRRRDIDTTNWRIRVSRAVVVVHVPKSEQVEGQPKTRQVVGAPKSDAGIRTVPIPAHVRPLIREHLAEMGVHGRDALLFPAAGDPTHNLRPGSLAKVFQRARIAIDRPDLRFHDLRHTFGSNATRVGANLPEVMALMGHSTPAAAMRYQHETQGRAEEISAALAQLADPDAATGLTSAQ